jgi:outer membrane protein OmpA-like peptidoglycan-associated protein
MKAQRSFTGSLALGAIASLLTSLSACLQSRDLSVQTAQVGNAHGAGTPAQEKVRLDGLRFKTDGASLRRSSAPVLDAAAEILRSEPDKKVYVDVYCDRTGRTKANLRLAQQRAENVKAHLAARGIPSERMIARGFGVENFATSYDPPLTRKQNSRVELIPFTTSTASTNLAYSRLGQPT